MDTTPILLRLKYRRRAKNQKLVYVQVFLETPDRVYSNTITWVTREKKRLAARRFGFRRNATNKPVSSG